MPREQRAIFPRDRGLQFRMLFTIFLLTVGLCEAMYFINLAFMAVFVFATP